ncbi:hypothetical protein C4K68_12755 [Pokkaliibacter plantistimulans]|uniref:Uncharacterized protein n=1 Tax=Proteobacteria bacterium 228 TaxID=2083153 RepID=A0A2S5KQE3_9PROT|nr:hypothetical protein C4K68_12755 [Pokkaliibacter plantistimulans]
MSKNILIAMFSHSAPLKGINTVIKIQSRMMGVEAFFPAGDDNALLYIYVRVYKIPKEHLSKIVENQIRGNEHNICRL